VQQRDEIGFFCWIQKLPTEKKKNPISDDIFWVLEFSIVEAMLYQTMITYEQSSRRIFVVNAACGSSCLLCEILQDIVNSKLLELSWYLLMNCF